MADPTCDRLEAALRCGRGAGAPPKLPAALPQLLLAGNRHVMWGNMFTLLEDVFARRVQGQPQHFSSLPKIPDSKKESLRERSETLAQERVQEKTGFFPVGWGRVVVQFRFSKAAARGELALLRSLRHCSQGLFMLYITSKHTTSKVNT